MPTKRLLTIDDLYDFCEKQNIQTFSSSKTGKSVVVQVPTRFESEEFNSEKGLTRIKCKVFHTGLNVNKSFISKENAERCMTSLKNRPILANIHQLSDGTWDFRSHDMEIETNENGEEIVNYIEKQIGSFTEDEPELVKDDENDKYFIVANAVIPEEYTKASEILQRKNGSKGSVELSIDDFSFNAKEKYLEINDFYVSGYTLLGSYEDKNGKVIQIQEGMKGARADIQDFEEFSKENNSMFNSVENDCVDKNQKKGGNDNMNKVKKSLVEELLAKYEKTVEDIEFAYDKMSDEELKAKFEEVFGEKPSNKQVDNEEKSIIFNRELAENGDLTIRFELSHKDIQTGLYQLLEMQEQGDEPCFYFIEKVYDSHFVFEDWYSGKYYSMKYKRNQDTLTLDGEKEEIFPVFVNKEEKESLEERNALFEEMKKELASYKEKEETAKKEEVLKDASYQEYLKEEEFVELSKNMNSYSVEEFKDKAEIAFAKCVKRVGRFEAKEAQSSLKSIFNKKENTSNENGRYGSIFKK